MDRHPNDTPECRAWHAARKQHRLLNRDRRPADWIARNNNGEERRIAKIWWLAFLATWRKIGEYVAVLGMAPNDYERWLAQWSFDLHGRRVMLKTLVPYDLRRADGGIFRRGSAKPWNRP